jgi:hypothetical protein
LAERLEDAHERGVAERVTELVEPALLVLGCINAHLPAAGVQEERVAHGTEHVFGDAARLVPGVEQRAHRDEDTGRVLGGHGVEHRGPEFERCAPEQVGDGAGVEAVGAVGERLVKQ